MIGTFSFLQEQQKMLFFVDNAVNFEDGPMIVQHAMNVRALEEFFSFPGRRASSNFCDCVDAETAILQLCVIELRWAPAAAVDAFAVIDPDIGQAHQLNVITIGHDASRSRRLPLVLSSAPVDDWSLMNETIEIKIRS